MTVYWPGVILCVVGVVVGLAVWRWVLADEFAAEEIVERADMPIVLEHRGQFYEVDDIWDAIVVSRILERLDRERDAA